MKRYLPIPDDDRRRGLAAIERCRQILAERRKGER